MLARVLPNTGEFALLQDSSDNEIAGKTVSLLFCLTVLSGFGEPRRAGGRALF